MPGQQHDRIWQGMNQAHIVGISPRSGTTLMAVLMRHCFDFDAWADHELPVYFAHLGIVLSRMKHLRRVQGNRRFVSVKYEDLVSDPDRIQTYLKSRVSFLRQTANFSEFHSIAKPTKSSVAAMSGVRPISTTSIGRWREHLPRIRAQVERFPEIVDVLIELGYENDNEWMRELESIVADNGRSYFEDRPSRPLRKFRQTLVSSLFLMRQQLGLPKKTRVLLKTSKRP